MSARKRSVPNPSRTRLTISFRELDGRSGWVSWARAIRRHSIHIGTSFNPGEGFPAKSFLFAGETGAKVKRSPFAHGSSPCLRTSLYGTRLGWAAPRNVPRPAAALERAHRGIV